MNIKDLFENNKVTVNVKPILIFLILVTIYHFIFKNFFPTPSGNVGHDFPLTLASYYDGFLWFLNNGVFNPPWFTPSFCGGIPFFADPQSGYYSLPQFLTFITSPLNASYWTLLISASVGYWGFYRLMRMSFDASEQSSILAAALFMFNGFLLHRLIVGEYGFHGIMFIPLIASLLIASKKEEFSDKKIVLTLKNSVFAGLLIAYWFQSGLTTLIIPSALSVIGIACIAFLIYRADWLVFLIQSALASIIALGISASKLVAGWSFFENFPRTQYLMPGIDGFNNTILLIIQSLFFSNEATTWQAFPLLKNSQWPVLPHEWAYSISVVPLLILIAGFSYLLIKYRSIAIMNLKLKISSVLFFMVFIVIITIPVMLLVYTPTWNTILKSIPIINTTAWPFRWIIVYIPILITISALIFDWIPFRKNSYGQIAFYTIISIMLLQSIYEPRDYYLNQHHHFNQLLNPTNIEQAYHRVKSTSIVPPITQIAVMQDATGKIMMPFSRNDVVAFGFSQLFCYNPIFGYALEKFPIKSLEPGPVLEQRNGILNIKNPACYVFPKENHCEPGDHFTVNDYDRAQAFVEYRPWQFEKSLKQKVADYITMISLALTTITLFFVLYRLVNRSLRNNSSTF